MYYTIVATLMFAFPLLSVGIESSGSGASLGAVLIVKWFVFWSVGWRLLLAGTRQVAQPSYTARVILGLKSEESLFLVRELGFANIGMGSVGVLSFLIPPWQLAVAVAGGVFYGLAGINHALQPHKNRLERVAMVSDLWVSVVLLGGCAAAALGK